MTDSALNCYTFGLVKDGFVRAYARFVTRHPGKILLVTALLAVVAVRISMGLTTRPSRMDMVPDNDPAVAAWREFNADFHGLHTVLMIVEGPLEKSRPFVEEAAGMLRAESKWVRSVTHKADIARLEAQGLYLLDRSRLDEIERGLIELTPFVREVSTTPTITRTIGYLGDEMGDEEAPPQETPKAIKGVELVRDVVRSLKDTLENPDAKDLPKVFPTLAPKAKKGKQLGRDEQGYILSKSGQRLLVVLTPAMELREAKQTRDLLEAITPKIDALKAKHPGVEYVFTGGAIRSLEEETTVRQDMHKTAILAGIAVILLCRMFFQGILPGLMLDFGLWLSILFNGALTKIFVGHINLIGAVFIPLLLGLGEDFGNYLMLTYQDSGKPEGPETMEDAIVLSFRGCFLGALTTAAVFYALMFHDFKAYRDMGFICGNGIMLAWLANYLFLPSFMMLRCRVPWLVNQPKGQEYHERFSLLGRTLASLQKPRKTILVAAILLTWFTADSVNHIRFDYNLANMLSSGANTVKLEKILHDEFSLSTEFAVVSAVALEDVYTIQESLESRPEVSTLDGLALFIPREVDTKRDVVGRIAEWGASRPKAASSVPPEAAADTITALTNLRAATKRPRSLANMSESPELHKVIDELEQAIDAAKALLEKTPAPVATKAYEKLHRGTAHDLDHFTNFLGSAVGVKPYTFETLPEEIRQRYVSPSGRLITYVTPAGDLSTEKEARGFYEMLLATEKLPAKGKVPPPSDKPGPKKPIEVAGIPLIVFRMMELVRSGFSHAAIGAMAVCFLMVLIDMRSLSLALLAMLPVLMGATWMTGFMAHFNMPWNPLDSIAIPILPGCGIAFGVNIIHRMLVERDLKVTMASTGRAALYSAFTTCVGFSVLLLANHRGLQSFAKVMVVGDAACCIACLFVLPILLTHLVKEKPSADSH